MRKPTIAIDIDDVLVPHFQDLIDWYNREYGTSLTIADNERGHEAWGVQKREEAIRRVHGFFAKPQFHNEEPFKEAKPVLVQLAKRYQLVAVTGREHMLEAETRTWLQQHFGHLVKEAYFTAYYNLDGKARAKAEICSEIGASYLVEDSLRHALPVAETGAVVLLFDDYPWNKTQKLPGGMVRCKDWAAVEEYFNGQR